jgi:hypothetical protein
MKIRRLQIEHQMAQIRIDSQMARISIETQVRGMRIEQQHAQMKVERGNPEIELDLTAFKENIGIKSISTIAQESAARAQSQAEQGIRETVQNGRFVATLPSSGNPIAQVARQKMLRVPASRMNSGAVPDGAVKMKGNPGELNINWTKNDLKIKWDEFQTPVITVEPKPPYVTVDLEKKPALEFTVVEQAYPPESGSTFDKEV